MFWGLKFTFTETDLASASTLLVHSARTADQGETREQCRTPVTVPGLSRLMLLLDIADIKLTLKYKTAMSTVIGQLINRVV